jgi:hypothetical protein
MSENRRMKRERERSERKVYNIPVEAMLTPFEFNELFDYLADYFIYSQRVLVVGSGKVSISDKDLVMSVNYMNRAVEKVIPLLEKCGLKNVNFELD